MSPLCYACDTHSAVHQFKGMSLCCDCYGCERGHGGPVPQEPPPLIHRPWWPWWCVAVVVWAVVTYWLWR